MSDILHYLPVLLVSIGMNILLGLYYKVGISRLSFDLKILLNGVMKAGIIGVVFIGMAFCFDRVDLSSLGINPCIFIHSAIFLYMGKAINNLAKILGVQVKRPSQNGESAESVLADAAATAASALAEPIGTALDGSDTYSELSTTDGTPNPCDPALWAKESESASPADNGTTDTQKTGEPVATDEETEPALSSKDGSDAGKESADAAAPIV